MWKAAALLALFLTGLCAAPAGKDQPANPRLKHSFRKPDQNGWIYVHLEGSPAEIGYQHGYLLAHEIADTEKAVALHLTHDSKPWSFFRDAAQNVFWPHIEAEYRAELEGIVQGLKAQGVKLDLWDLIATNAWLELDGYYTGWYDKKHAPVGEHCSAFIATGSFTSDGKPLIAHNNWTDYLTGSRWNIIFDITPSKGYHFIMDGMPGLIHSGDDFGINSAGLMITETTISQFHGFDPNGVPEFVRARKAMQHSGTIDEFVGIMKDGNNGGYANDWLVADRKTNEIASLELGLKNINLKRTKDGYFVGSNYPIDPKLISEETDFPIADSSVSPNARHLRWDDLIGKNKGRLDVALAKRFLSDHYDTFEKKDQPSERTLCGHIDLSSRGSKPWMPAYGAAGAVQAKAANSTMAAKMSFEAAMGHPCGIHFKAADHLKRHPEFAWQKPLLRDLDSRPWTTFQAGQ